MTQQQYDDIDKLVYRPDKEQAKLNAENRKRVYEDRIKAIFEDVDREEELMEFHYGESQNG